MFLAAHGGASVPTSRVPNSFLPQQGTKAAKSLTSDSRLSALMSEDERFNARRSRCLSQPGFFPTT
jgi:hypothetical protein